MTRIWDVTLPYSSRLPSWPGEGRPTIERISRISDGANANVTRLSACVHYATHVDAPVHFIEGGAGVDALPLEALIGKVRVIALPGRSRVERDDLGSSDLAGVERLLIKTDNSALWNDLDHEFCEHFTALSVDAARWIVASGIRLVGIDYLSVEPFGSPEPLVHRTLLSAGVVALEGLDLQAVEPGDYRLICLPMKLVGADGAPARVVLTEL
ncbi:MAG TPA: cyclase family protein [Stellaceae bacterium]|nr:cyclase family protein [Stellaceae bacterium]